MTANTSRLPRKLCFHRVIIFIKCEKRGWVSSYCEERKRKLDVFDGIDFLDTPGRPVLRGTASADPYRSAQDAT